MKRSKFAYSIMQLPVKRLEVKGLRSTEGVGGGGSEKD